MPWISLSAKAVLRPSRPCRTTASSSAVRSGTVAIRQWSTTRSSSNTPSTVLVLPTSMVSSTAEIRFCVLAVRAGPLVGGQHHRRIVDQPGAARGDRGHDQGRPGLGRAERVRIDHRDVVDTQGGLGAQDLHRGGPHGGRGAVATPAATWAGTPAATWAAT